MLFPKLWGTLRPHPPTGSKSSRLLESMQPFAICQSSELSITRRISHTTRMREAGQIRRRAEDAPTRARPFPLTFPGFWWGGLHWPKYRRPTLPTARICGKIRRVKTSRPPPPPSLPNEEGGCGLRLSHDQKAYEMCWLPKRVKAPPCPPPLMEKCVGFLLSFSLLADFGGGARGRSKALHVRQAIGLWIFFCPRIECGGSDRTCWRARERETGVAVGSLRVGLSGESLLQAAEDLAEPDDVHHCQRGGHGEEAVEP